MTVHKDKVIAALKDGNIQTWSTLEISESRLITEHNGSVKAVVADERYFYTASVDKSIIVWDKKVSLTFVDQL